MWQSIFQSERRGQQLRRNRSFGGLSSRYSDDEIYPWASQTKSILDLLASSSGSSSDLCPSSMAHKDNVNGGGILEGGALESGSSWVEKDYSDTLQTISENEVVVSDATEPTTTSDTNSTDAWQDAVYDNRSFEAWEEIQNNWRGNANSRFSVRCMFGGYRRNRRMSKSERRDLEWNLTKQKTFDLPRRMPLKDVVGIYSDAWAREDDDSLS